MKPKEKILGVHHPRWSHYTQPCPSTHSQWSPLISSLGHGLMMMAHKPDQMIQFLTRVPSSHVVLSFLPKATDCMSSVCWKHTHSWKVTPHRKNRHSFIDDRSKKLCQYPGLNLMKGGLPCQDCLLSLAHTSASMATVGLLASSPTNPIC